MVGNRRGEKGSEINIPERTLLRIDFLSRHDNGQIFLQKVLKSVETNLYCE